MAVGIPALIEPGLLKWARKCSNMSLEQAALKIPVKPEKLESWEYGTSQPSIRQLRKVASLYKKPIATFYMEKHPHGYTIMRDFRQIAEKGKPPFSSELIYEVQNTHYQRENAIELFGLLKYKCTNTRCTTH